MKSRWHFRGLNQPLPEPCSARTAQKEESMNRANHIVMLLLIFLCTAVAAFGQAETPAPKVDTGDTAWMLTSAALVLFMTIPGLFLFYGGLVRSKNVLGMLMQN